MKCLNPLDMHPLTSDHVVSVVAVPARLAAVHSRYNYIDGQ